MRKNAQGFSLVELMVAVLIGLLVLSGVIQVVVSSKRSFIENQEVAFIQDNTRYAMDIIAKDLRAAGYQGCARQNYQESNIVAAATVTSFAEAFGNTPLKGYEAGVPTGVTKSASNLSSSADSLTVRTVNFEQESVLKTHSPSNKVLTAWAATTYKTGQPLVVTDVDCKTVAIFLNNEVSGHTEQMNYGTGNCNAGLIGSYACGGTGAAPNTVKAIAAGARIFPYLANTYFIGDSSVLANMPALKRRYLDVNAGVPAYKTEEIAQGVEDMQIQYALDANNDGIIDAGYSDATNTTVWADVAAVRIVMIFRSNNKGPTPGTSGDGFIRKTVTSTIQIRNRGA